MQERIRYYITKSGEELTVRSVKVAKGSPRRDDVDPSIPDEVAEAKSPSRPGSPPTGAVRRRDNGAGPGRPTES
jgi:hypothetical protein